MTTNGWHPIQAYNIREAGATHTHKHIDAYIFWV